MIIRQNRIGQNRGRPRLWLDGQWLAAAGFAPGDRYQISTDWNRAVIARVADGQNPPGVRRVSGRPGGKPIIDIAGRAVENMFAAVPAAVEIAYRPGAGILFIQAAPAE